MVSFNPVNNDQTKAPVVEKTSGVSFKPTGESIDASKFNAASLFSIDGSNIESVNKVNFVNDVIQKSWFEQGREESLQKTQKNLKDLAVFGDSISKSVVTGYYKIGEGLGNLVQYYGDNMIITKEQQEILGLDDKTTDRLNSFGRAWQKTGNVISKGANFVLESKQLRLDEETFSGSITENPSVTRVSSVIAGAIPSLSFMGSVGKVTGSYPLGYFLMAGSESSDLYIETRDETEDQNKANFLFATSMAGTAALDLIARPAEKIFSPEAVKGWRRKVVQRVTNGLFEGSTESGQELWQNAVRKYGLDSTQNLTDGLIEAALGGFGGGVMMTGAYNKAVNELKSRGATSADIELLSEVIGQQFSKDAEGINKIVEEDINKSLDTLDKYVTENAEFLSNEQMKKELDAVYDEMYEVLSDNMDPVQAKYNAKLAQGWALFGAKETGLSPTEYMKERFPQIVSDKQTETIEKKNLRRDIEKIKDPRLIKKEPALKSLAQFLKENGGLKDFQGELKAIGAGEVKGLVKEDGVSIDDAALAAWELGYFKGQERPDVNEFLDALQEDLSGNRIFAENRDMKTEASYIKELASELERAGVDVRNDDIDTIYRKYKEYQNAYRKSESRFAYENDLTGEVISDDDWGDFTLFQNTANYNDKGQLLTDSQDFKNWFGDSKVVDESGKPLVVYHGTVNKAMTEFRTKSETGASTQGSYLSDDKKAFFFTNDKSIANNYSYGIDPETRELIGGTLSVYLSLKNPRIIDVRQELSQLDFDIKTEREEAEEYGYPISRWLGEATTDLEANDSATAYLDDNMSTIYDDAIDNGNDGIIVEGADGSITYVVFEPTQIKSVNNRGTFDANNPNIYYQSNLDAKVNIKGDELGQYNDVSELRNLAERYMRQNLKDKRVYNFDIGKDIYFRTSSIKKYLSLSADIEKLQAVPFLRQIVEQGRIIDKKPSYAPDKETSIVAYYTLQTPVNFNGKVKNVVTIIKEDNKGNFFWDLQTNKKEFSAYPATNPAERTLYQELPTDPATNPGGETLDGNNVAQKSGDVNINIEILPIAQEGINGKQARGSITFAKDMKAVINLFETADASTFIHEMGHFFLRELNEFAKYGHESKARLDAVNKWLEADGSGVYTTEQQEKFARGFEQFVREGKAPSSYLKQVFSRFAEWLRNIYKTAEELGVELNDDIRKVYADIFGGQELDVLMSRDNPLNSKNFDKAWEMTIRHVSEEEAKEKQSFYAKNFNAATEKRSATNKLIGKTKDQVEGIREWVADAIVPLESEIMKISPEIAIMNRRLEISKMQRLNNYQKKIKGFVEGMEKLSKKDFYDLDLALKNRDNETADAIINRNNLREEYEKVQNLLEELYQGLVDIGAEVGYLEKYFPRRIKDTDGFLDFINLKVSESNQKILEKAIIEREQRGEKVSEEEKKKLLEGGLHSKIRDIIAEREKRGAVLSNEDKARIVNSLIRGYGGNITLANIGNVKSREIEFVDADMNSYYKLSTDALVDYVAGVATLIEDKKYFGKENKEISALRTRLMGRRRRIKEYEDMDASMVKGREIRRLNYEIGGQESKSRNAFKEEDRADAEDRKKYLESQVEFFAKLKAGKVKEIVMERMQKEYDDIQKELDVWDSETIEQSVGKMVLDLVEAGKIDAKKEKRLRELLTARFDQKGMSNTFLKTLRDGGYLATLGNVESAITQLGDLAMSAYEGGFLISSQEFGKALIGKSQITKEMVGLENVIIQEMNEGATALSRSLDKVLGMTGFERIDRLGKETLMNSAIEKMRKQAREAKPNRELMEYLEAAYKENAAKVKEDLANGAVTPEIVELAMFKLMDYQPITIDQLPRYYAVGGNARLFYSLKSYTVRMVDVFRKIAVDKMRKDPVGGLKDLMMLSAYMMIYNAGADLLKDLLFGRPIDIPDTVADNLFMGGVFNKYTINKFKMGGAGAVVKDLLFPPVVGDVVTKEVLSNKDVKDYRAWANLPVVGRFYYWYAGGGVEKKEKEAKKQRNKIKNEILREKRERNRKKRKDVD